MVFGFYEKFLLAFNFKILDHNSKFVHSCINDAYNNSNWLVSFVYDYPQHHLQKQLWKLIGNISDKESKPWLILGDLNEFSSPDEKYPLVKILLVSINLMISLTIITLMI